METIIAYSILISFCMIISNLALYFHNKRKTAILSALRKALFVSSNNELNEIYSKHDESKIFHSKKITCGDYSEIIADSLIQRVYDMIDLCKHLCIDSIYEKVVFYTYAYNTFFIKATLSAIVEPRYLKAIIENSEKIFVNYTKENFADALNVSLKTSVSQVHNFLSKNCYHSTSDFYCTDSLSNIANEYISSIIGLENLSKIKPIHIIEITRLFLSWIPNEHLISDYRLQK